MDRPQKYLPDGGSNPQWKVWNKNNKGGTTPMT